MEVSMDVPVSTTITPSTTGFVQPERDSRGNQIRLAELFKEDAVQANDIFHFVEYKKGYSDGSPSNIYVNAAVVVRVQDKMTKNNSSPIEFDILENGQRSFLGAFTGPKGIAEALTRNTGGIRRNTPFDRLWEDFEVLRNGQSLGTAGDVRNQYYVTYKASSNRPTSKSAPRDSPATAATPPALSETLYSLGFAGPGHSPRLTASFLTQANQSNREKTSDYQLAKAELSNALPKHRQPKRAIGQDTMISAAVYIKFLQARLRNAYEMIILMGIEEESLKNMVHQMDNGVEVPDAMRNGLEWSEAGPLGDIIPAEDTDE